MTWIKQIWKRYCDWCDRMGLTPEARRCCAPSLTDPELERIKVCPPKSAQKTEHAD
ncbi:MAG: DUF5363 domain-containing protein [Shewanella sp.]|nr:DUF5363 domain-containing protein [Shewanella sp.]MCF1431422.1 DUF5363 domain-containing protein [Shewanella sp.]MCF1438403.1 DUF5363 domain-containing protein [Shewanella sp.]MCF1458656.1 DUF5363 domain-containing protein [Shewanella sp.]